MALGLTYKEQIERAQAAGNYEPFRGQMVQLLSEGYTRSEIARIVGLKRARVEFIVAVLGLQVGRGKRPARAGILDADAIAELATQRHQEHHWVRCFREAYGPVGKGFSIA